MYAETRPIVSSRELQQLLRSILSAELGVFKTGQPAIWTEPPFAPSRGTGLHCVIKRQPGMIKHDPLCSNQANQTYEFEVVFTADQDANTLAAMDRAITKMRSTFPRCRELVLPSADGKLAQANFYLIFSRTLNTIPIPTI